MNYTFKDTQNGLHNRILPAVAKFNATDQEINFGQDALWNSIGTSDFFLAVKFRTSDKTSTMGIVGPSRVGVFDKFGISTASTGLIYNILKDNLPIDATSFNYRIDTIPYNVNETYIAIINADRSGNMTCYLNGILVGTKDMSEIVASNLQPANDMRVGSYGLEDNSNGSLWFNGNIYWAKFGKNLLTPTEIADIENYQSTWACYPVGNPVNEYDVYGSRNGVWNGNTAKRIQYLTDGESFHNEKGISLWESGANKEYIPYYNGAARADAQAPVGYTKTFDSPYVVSQWNLSKGTINFNPMTTADSKLDIFNKANSIIHIATGSMDYYNASLPYEWTFEELSSYAKYNSYFNTDYQDRLFVKIIDYSLVEILNCTAKQTGSALTKAKTYCGIT